MHDAFQEMCVEFQTATFWKKKTEKLAIFKSSPSRLVQCIAMKLSVLPNKSARICFIVFGDTVIQSLKSRKIRSGLVPMSR